MHSWRELIERAYSARRDAEGTSSKPAFYPPVAIPLIATAEDCLITSFPAPLKTLLRESDGVMDMLSVSGGDFFESLWLVWPVQVIQEENLRFRERVIQENSNHDARDLLFFATAGTDGILFGLRAAPSESTDCPVLAWYPLGNRLVHLTDSLADFMVGWLTNRITV